MNKIIKILCVLTLMLSMLGLHTKEVEAKGTASDLVDVVKGEIGNKYKSKYSLGGGNSSAWCASFVSWAAREAGIPTSVIPTTASSANMKSKTVSLGGKIVSSPKAGDLVFYKKSSSGNICHVGIMVSSTMSVQGNYSKQVKYMDPYSYIDGNGKKTNKSRMIFVRPNYNKASTDTDTNTETSKPVTKPTPKPVTKTNIKKFSVKGLPTEVEFTGKAIKPEITLYNGSKKISTSSYSVSYSNNTNPGTATLKVTGKGNYTGTITKTFKILSVDQSKLDALKKTVPTDLTVYSDETVKSLNDLLKQINDTKTLTQKGVNDFVTKLQKAIGSLEYKLADYTLVDEAIKLVPTDLEPYSEESVQLLNDALNAVVRDYNILKQEEVNLMATNINNAIDGLEKKPPILEMTLGISGLAGIILLAVKKFRKPKVTQ